MEGIIIAYFCLQALDLDKHKEACTKASEAAVVQIGARQQLKNLERFGKKKAEKIVDKRTTGVVVGFYTIYSKGGIVYSMKNIKIANVLSLSLTSTEQKFALTWYF